MDNFFEKYWKIGLVVLVVLVVVFSLNFKPTGNIILDNNETNVSGNLTNITEGDSNNSINTTIPITYPGSGGSGGGGSSNTPTPDPKIEDNETEINKTEIHFSNITITNLWSDFYGGVLINNENASVGDEVGAFDSLGNLCGNYEIKQEGVYGFLHCYKEDSSLENISFRFYDWSEDLELNLTILSGNPVWQEKVVIEVNLEVE